MKRLLIVLIVCVMMLATSVTALGAVHDSRGDFWNIPVNEYIIPYDQVDMGGWFYIGTRAPFMQVSYSNSTGGDVDAGYGYLQFAAETWKNDFTFLEGYQLFVAEYEGYNPAAILGSYLLGNGIFFGLSTEYVSEDNDDYSVLFSVGYKIDITERFYVAPSIDFYFDDSANVTGFEVDYRYSGEKTRIFGQVYLVSDEFANDPNWDDLNIGCLWYDLNINYQLTESFVLGGKLASYDEESQYMIGFSWYGSSLTLDAAYTSLYDGDENMSAVSAMYNFDAATAIGIGWATYSEYDASVITLKGKFAAFCDGEAQIGYRLYNEDVEDVFGAGITLTYFKKL